MESDRVTAIQQEVFINVAQDQSVIDAIGRIRSTALEKEKGAELAPLLTAGAAAAGLVGGGAAGAVLTGKVFGGLSTGIRSSMNSTVTMVGANVAVWGGNGVEAKCRD
jgi:hypothetical protein